MPILNPQLYKKNFKIEDIHSITLESFSVTDDGLWINPAIRITTKQEVEEKIKSDPFIQLQKYIEFNKNTGLFYIRKCTNEGNGWKHCIPYGSYDTLQEAKEMVDFLEAHDWNEEEYKQFKNEL